MHPKRLPSDTSSANKQIWTMAPITAIRHNIEQHLPTQLFDDDLGTSSYRSDPSTNTHSFGLFGRIRSNPALYAITFCTDFYRPLHRNSQREPFNTQSQKETLNRKNQYHTSLPCRHIHRFLLTTRPQRPVIRVGKRRVCCIS